MPKIRKLSDQARELLLAKLKTHPRFRPGLGVMADADIVFWCRHFKIDIAEVERNA